MSQVTISSEEAYKKRKIGIAKAGLFIAWISSLTAVSQGIFNSASTGIVSDTITSTVSPTVLTILIAITLLAVNDIIAGIFLLIYNLSTGRSFKEYKRMCNVKVSWMMLLSALAAGPFATGCWMSSVSFCGITYTTAVISLAPILTAIVGRFVFKENTNARVYFGIVIAVAGVIVAGWAKPEGMTNLFYVGNALAAIAPIGFTVEGMLSTYAGDLVDPLIGCGFYRCFGSGVLGFILISIVAAIFGDISVVGRIIALVFTTPKLFILVVIMGLFAGISYATTYVGFNKSGPTKTLAVVNTMPVWSIPLGYLFAAIGIYDYEVTTMGIVGALIVVVGIILVIAKPSELFNLRDV